MRTVIDHTMYCGTAVTDFVEAMGGAPHTKFFVTTLWMRAAEEDAADGIIKITPSRLKRDLLEYEISVDVYMQALLSAGIIVPVEGRPEYFYLTNWIEINGEYYRGKARQAQYMRDYRARRRGKKAKPESAQDTPPENRKDYVTDNVKITPNGTRVKSRDTNVRLTQGLRKDNVSGSVSVAGSGSVAVSGSVPVAGSPNQDPGRNKNLQKTLEAATNQPPQQVANTYSARPQSDGLAVVYHNHHPQPPNSQALDKPHEVEALGEAIVEHPKIVKSRNDKVRAKVLANPLPKPATEEHVDMPMTGAQMEALLINTYGMSNFGHALAANQEFFKLARERAFTWSELNHAVEEARHFEAGDPAKYIATVLVSARSKALKTRDKKKQSTEDLEREVLERLAGLTPEIIEAHRSY